jgi:hypothetical protein
LLKDKVKKTTLGEATYNDAQVEVEKFENSIAMVELELVDLLQEYNVIFEQLHEMEKGGIMSF